MSNVAVVLSGCGVFDGAEIHESVLTLLYLARAGAQVRCFAPDKAQMHVIDHMTGEAMAEQRNVLVESARIARGQIEPLASLKVEEFDALVVPGGFGVAKNLSDFATAGSACTVEPALLEVAQGFARQGKWALYFCIAPALLPRIYGAGVQCTIGSDAATAAALAAMGGQHVTCGVTDVAVDEARRVISAPAYMLAASILEADQSIALGVDALMKRLA